MGYIYQGRKLCCDVCLAAGARKVKCPVNYCQAYAVCSRPECKAKVKAIDHSGCRARHNKHAAELADLKAGKASFTVKLRAGVMDHTTDKGKRYGYIEESNGHDYGFAAMELYNKTWVSVDDIEALRALGNTVTVVEASGAA